MSYQDFATFKTDSNNRITVWHGADFPPALTNLWFNYGKKRCAIDFIVRNPAGSIVAIGYDYRDDKGNVRGRVLKSRASITKIMRAAAHAAATKLTKKLL